MSEGKTLSSGGAERARVVIGEIELFEPATRAEVETLWERLEHDPKEQNAWFGVTRESFCDTLASRRRTLAAYHRGVLMGVASFEDLADGTCHAVFTRTRDFMAKGHKLACAKSFGRVLREVVRDERARGRTGRILALIPTKYERGIRFYERDAGCRVIGRVDGRGHGLTVLEVMEKEGE